MNPNDSITHSTILHAIQDTNIGYFDELLSSGFDINAPYSQSYLIHTAAACGNLDVINYLVDKGVDLHVVNNLKYNAVHFATIFNHLEVVKFFVKNGVDINLQNEKGNTPLHESILKHHLDICSYLIDSKANLELKNFDGATPLHFSVQFNYYDFAHKLIKAGANVNAQDNHTNTILHSAANQSDYTLTQLLIDNKANIDTPNKLLKTPLHFASYRVSKANIKILIDAGADVNLQDSDGQTPLHLFMQTMDNNLMTFIDETFLTKPINFSLKNKHNENLLHIAACSGYLNIFQKAISTPNFEKDLKSRNIDKQNVFDLAIQINHPDIIDFIKTYQEYMSIKASLPQNDNINNSKKIKL